MKHRLDPHDVSYRVEVTRKWWSVEWTEWPPQSSHSSVAEIEKASPSSDPTFRLGIKEYGYKDNDTSSQLRYR